jgi:DnaJ-class molecular chaperone
MAKFPNLAIDPPPLQWWVSVKRAAAHERYLEISLAYSVLHDANKRKIYDHVRYSLKEKGKSI